MGFIAKGKGGSGSSPSYMTVRVYTRAEWDAIPDHSGMGLCAVLDGTINYNAGRLLNCNFPYNAADWTGVGTVVDNVSFYMRTTLYADGIDSINGFAGVVPITDTSALHLLDADADAVAEIMTGIQPATPGILENVTIELI